jgi:hypothetical protein
MKIRYRIISQDDGAYSIEVREGASNPYIVPGFKSEAEAVTWATVRAVKSMDQWSANSTRIDAIDRRKGE